MNIPFASTLLAWHVYRVSQRRSVRPLAEFELAKVRRVLLVLTTGIGDAIFSSTVFASIRRAVPQAEIALFCRPGWHDLFASDPNLNKIISYPGKFRAFFRTLGELRRFGPDLAVILHGNDPDVIPLCYLAGSHFIVRIPTAGTRFGGLLSNSGRPEDAATMSELHYVDNRVRILDTLGIPILNRTPSMHLDPALVKRISRLLADYFHGRPYWVLHVHAADPYKTVPETLAKELIAKALSTFPSHNLVLTGGPENREALQALVPAKDAERVFVAAGKFSLVETGACLARADAVVGPDTGVLHLAAALDRPVIGLYAPTRPLLVGPRSPSHRPEIIEKPLTCDPCMQKKCPHNPVKCMAQFSPQEVLAALARSLSA